MDKPRKFIDIVIPFNNEYLNLQILLPKILRVLKKIKYFKLQAYMPVEYHVHDNLPWNIHNELANLYKNIDVIIEKKTKEDV